MGVGYKTGTVTIAISDYLDLVATAEDARSEQEIVAAVKKNLKEFLAGVLNRDVGVTQPREVSMINFMIDDFFRTKYGI